MANEATIEAETDLVRNLTKQIKLSGTSVFGYLVNATTLTAEAVAHTINLQCVAV